MVPRVVVWVERERRITPLRLGSVHLDVGRGSNSLSVC